MTRSLLIHSESVGRRWLNLLGAAILSGAVLGHPLPTLAAAEPSAQIVAPGVWKITLGEPEKITPVGLRDRQICAEALAAMPPAEQPPLDVKAFLFTTSARGCAIEMPMVGGEQIYGFGLHLKTFNAANTAQSIIINELQTDEDGSSHGAVPFYVSNRGYGVLVDTTRYARFYCGNLVPLKRDGEPKHPAGKTVSVDIPVARGADVYLFAGPSMKEAVQRYNLFSGGGCLPPLWGLGVYYRGYGKANAEEILKIARRLREKHIPVDVMGLEPGWQTHAYSCTFVWSPERWPDPAGFIKQMTDMGFQLNLWEHAFTHPTSPLYESLKPLAGDYEVWGGLVPDFSLPEARKIFADYHEREFVKKGIAGFKLDECDNQPHRPNPWSFPEISRFPGGFDGEQMHTMFGPLYQRTIEDTFRRNDMRTYGKVRAAGALAAPLPYVLYTDHYDHRDFVRGIPNAGFCGMLWQPEVRSCDSVEDLYRRSQTTIFSPQTVFDAWFLPQPPWLQIDEEKSKKGELMPERGEAEAHIRKLCELRTSLIPYLYAAFAEYHLHGLPPFRAVVMDWPQDPATFKLDDQYSMGDSMLVAPMFAGQKKRSVYLPEGNWYCFWTHKKYPGKQKHEIEMGVDRIPVFVREGTLLPLAEPVEHVRPDTVFKLRVLAFGDTPKPITLYEDDGRTYAFDKGEYNTIKISWDQGDAPKLDRKGRFSGQRYEIVEQERVGGK